MIYSQKNIAHACSVVCVQAITECAMSILEDLSDKLGISTAMTAIAGNIFMFILRNLDSFTKHVNALNEHYTRVHLFFTIFEKVHNFANDVETSTFRAL